MSLPRGVGGFETLNALDLLLQLFTGNRAQEHVQQAPQAVQSHIDQGMERGRELADQFGELENPDPFRAAYQLGAGTRPEVPEGTRTWEQTIDFLDILDDFGIAAQRRFSGELGHDSGITETIFREAQRALMEGDGYRSPFRHEAVGEYDDDLTDHGFRPAGLGERVLGGVMTPYGGAADLTNLGIRGARGIANIAQKGMDGVLSLAAGVRHADAGAVPLRTLGRDELHRYSDAVQRLPEHRRAFLTEYTPEQLLQKHDSGAIFRMTDDGAGYILDGGELQGLINTTGRRGAGAAALDDAIGHGAERLDAFQGPLTDLYESRGFRETGRATFDPQYASPHWDEARYGTPDVVFMERHADDMVGLAHDLAPGARRATDVAHLEEAVARAPTGFKGAVRLLQHIVSTGESGIAARRVGTSHRRAHFVRADGKPGRVIVQGAERKKWVERQTAAMTDDHLDSWANTIRRGTEVEESHRMVTLGDGQQVRLEHWYDTEPVLRELQTALGDKPGEMVYGMLMALTATTSPMTAVRDNVDIAVSMLHHITRGTTFDQIARMTAREFGTISPGKALYHAGYAGNEGAMRQISRGPLNNFVERGTIRGQKISSFFRNLMGDYRPLTVDSHNIRQTLALSGVDTSTAAGRRELLNAWGVGEVSDLRPFLEDVVRVADKDGVLQTIRQEDVSRAFADALYGTVVSDSGVYSAIEGFQVGVLNRLIESGRLPQMTPAEFQARLWVGAPPDVTQVRDSVPAAQAMIDAIRKYGTQVVGTDDIGDAIRHMWQDPQGGNVLLDAVYNAGEFAKAGIQSPQELGEMIRLSSRVGRQQERMSDDEDDQDLLGMLMGLFGGQ